MSEHDMKQIAFSAVPFLTAVFLIAGSATLPAYAAKTSVQQQSPPIECVKDGCTDPYPGPQH